MRGDVTFMGTMMPGPSEKALHRFALLDIETIELRRQIDYAMQPLGRSQFGTGRKQFAGAGNGEWFMPFRHVSRSLAINPYVVGAGDLAPMNSKQLAKLDEAGRWRLLFTYIYRPPVMKAP